MAIAQVLQFIQQSSENIILQKQIEALMGVGDGNISTMKELDEAEAKALINERGHLVTEFAQKNGFDFSEEDLQLVISAFQNYNAGTISDDDLTEILGISKSELQARENITFVNKTIELIYRGVKYQKLGDLLIPPLKYNPKTEKRVGVRYPDMPAATPVAEVLQFIRNTSENIIFQKQLEALIGVGDGNISHVRELDQEEAKALTSERGHLVTEFAQKNGFNFSQEDLQLVISAFQRYNSGELSDQDLTEILGVPFHEEAFVKKSVEMIYRGLTFTK